MIVICVHAIPGTTIERKYHRDQAGNLEVVCLVVEDAEKVVFA